MQEDTMVKVGSCAKTDCVERISPAGSLRAALLVPMMAAVSALVAVIAY